jgi:hypothetical protein
MSAAIQFAGWPTLEKRRATITRSLSEPSAVLDIVGRPIGICYWRLLAMMNANLISGDLNNTETIG